MAEELEDPSHFRLLMSKHGEELGHYSVKERMQALHDFHNLGSIPEGKSQDLFNMCDKILSNRDQVKQLDDEINEIQHNVLDARKEAAEEEENVSILQQKIKDVKKSEGPNYKTLPILEKSIQKQRKNLAKMGRDQALKQGVYDALLGSSAPERYRVPKGLSEKDFGTFAGMSSSDLLNTCNALRLFLAQDSGASNVMESMKIVQETAENLEKLREENEDLRIRDRLSQENEALEDQIRKQEKKYARMKRSAAEEKEKRIEAMAVKETEEEMVSGLSPFNPVSIVNFFFGVGGDAEEADVLTKAERAKRKAIETHIVNSSVALMEGSGSLVEKKKSRKNRSTKV